MKKKASQQKQHTDQLWAEAQGSAGIGYHSRTDYPLQMLPEAGAQVMQFISVGELAKLKTYGLDVGSWAEFDRALALISSKDEVKQIIALLKSEKKTSATVTEALRKTGALLQKLEEKTTIVKEEVKEETKKESSGYNTAEEAELFSALKTYATKGIFPPKTKKAKFGSIINKLDDKNYSRLRKSAPKHARAFIILLSYPHSAQGLYDIVQEIKVAKLSVLPSVKEELGGRFDRLSDKELLKLNKIVARKGEIDQFDKDTLFAAPKAPGRAASLGVRIRIKFFMFWGADKSIALKHFNTALKIYHPHGIHLVLDNKIEILGPKASEAVLGNKSGKYTTVRSSEKQARLAEADVSRKIRQTYQAPRGTIPCYWFGKFNTEHGGFLSNLMGGKVLAFARNSNSVFLGTNTVNPTTFAHEIGHILGGHKYGKHVNNNSNLMHHNAERKESTLSAKQIRSFKASIFSQLWE